MDFPADEKFVENADQKPVVGETTAVDTALTRKILFKLDIRYSPSICDFCPF